ncbi:MAG: hypothetical protein JW702_04650 [Clostridiales bacterium]|nr:hypothetical protein [Clostridiales bacterium]
MKHRKFNLLLILLVVILSGCYSEQQSTVEENSSINNTITSEQELVRSFLEKIYTSSDEGILKLEELRSSLEKEASTNEGTKISEPPCLTSYFEYIHDIYDEYLSDDAFDKFVGNRLLDAAAWMYVKNELKLSIAHITINYNDGQGGYDFEVTYNLISKDGSITDSIVTSGILVVEEKIVHGRIDPIGTYIQ